jgi:hypothetical protein
MVNGSSGLPFSIDAALSGTIPTYTPKPAVAELPTLDEAMPKTWFFDIHEDTPEEEATNMMEHSACTLDISSDDDCETRLAREGAERGKENIPPPDFIYATTATNADTNIDDAISQMTGLEGEGAAHEVKLPKLRRPLVQDAMDQDRSPLSDLPAKDYYGAGLDESSFETVDATIDKSSGLSKEFEFEVPASPSPLKVEHVVEERLIEAEAPVEAEAQVEVPAQVEEQKDIPIYVDETAGAIVEAPAPAELQASEDAPVIVSYSVEVDEEL